MGNQTSTRVAAAQIEIEEPTMQDNIQHNLKKILKSIEEASEEKVQIVCFCEGALTGWLIEHSMLDRLQTQTREIEDAVKEIEKKCMEKKINTIVGIIYPTNNGFENQALVVDKNGVTHSPHLKVELTIPEKNTTRYRPGSSFNIFPIENIPCGIAICYEFEDFDYPCRNLAYNGAKIIFNPKHHRSPPPAHFWKENACKKVIEVTFLRARINRIYVVSVNRAVESKDVESYRKHPLDWQMSPSMIVDPHGIPLKLSYPLEEDLLVADIYI